MKLTALVIIVVMKAGNPMGYVEGKEIPIIPWPVFSNPEACERFVPKVLEQAPDVLAGVYPDHASLKLACYPKEKAAEIMRQWGEPTYEDLQGNPLMEL